MVAYLQYLNGGSQPGKKLVVKRNQCEIQRFLISHYKHTALMNLIYRMAWGRKISLPPEVEVALIEKDIIDFDGSIFPDVAAKVRRLLSYDSTGNLVLDLAE
tara:strand:- start:399 stop:704 length:306 start_codon:yes stop_codon:yes gene_type:complete